MSKKLDLIEVKKDSCGTGLLIENDGYINPISKPINENINGNDEWHVPYPFIVSAVFQKFGIKNANGRVYPEDVLKREVERYQQKIREKRALGECYSGDAMILTNDGWKNIIEVKEGELVLTLNVETNEIEIKPILKKIEYHYNGEMIRIKNRKINDFVTPNHKFPIYNRKNQFRGFFTAQDILEKNIKDFSNNYIPTCDDFNHNNQFKKITLDKRYLKVTTEHFNNNVYCIEVENHTWFVKQNDKCHWTGNCNHPSESTIDLGRISHNIVELHWEGSTLVGKLEIFTSHGFRKYGIVSTLGDMVANHILSGYKIGVSSRAVGSVEEKLGVLMVGDDLELICWDVVADPSTPNAWIYTDENEKQAYVESNKTNENKPLISEKINKIKNILLK